MFRRIAPAMVLDVDDGIFLAHPEKFRGLASMCDLVIAGNSLLAERVAMVNSRVAVIPTCLDTHRHALKPAGEAPATARPVLGWTGTEHNLNSLRLVSAPLRALRRTHDFELSIIAERPPSLGELNLSGLDVRYTPWREETEIRDLHGFDVGLMPLEDSEWTRFKCGLKILQYMAIGIPAVASPVGVNRDIIRSGDNGFLAASQSQWTARLATLLDDPALRARMGAAGRATVEQRYSVAANLPKFEAALRAASAERRSLAIQA
jgi:glycosyltransferase involved in cell wall biosynthesis